MKIICVIPARLQSTRFPRKILAPLGNKPLIQWVYEAAKKVAHFQEVVLAVDAEETRLIAEGFGAKVFMTSESCQSGTQRLIELVNRGALEADFFVNWQGDEPFISAQLIDELLQSIKQDDCSIWTLCKRTSEASSPHIVKVVRTHSGEALYFSRSPIPFYRDVDEKFYYKHIGIYAYTYGALKKIAALPASALEKAEQLEQLHFLQGGLKIKVHETTHEIFGIDTEEHLQQAKLLLDL